jgi:L-ascorbate metabolism protein UlaG (beta-lactamase superfamily)
MKLQLRHYISLHSVRKLLLFVSISLLLFFGEDSWAKDKSINNDKLSQVKQLLQKQLDEKEAYIWYLSHSGYAIKTKSVLLIFDYWEEGRDNKNEDDPPVLSLANGRINPEEIRELDVYVLVSHAHLDHYDQVIFEWEKKVKNISYIFGWQAKENPDYHYLTGPRSELNLGGMQISTINETHDGISGVCYLAKVDGICLYFSGDYGWAMLDSYQNDFKYLSTKAKSIDVAFLYPCYYQKDSDLVKLEIPANFIQRFSPKIVFPQHYGGREDLMAKFVNKTRDDFPLIKFESPRVRGERWHVKFQ